MVPSRVFDKFAERTGIRDAITKSDEVKRAKEEYTVLRNNIGKLIICLQDNEKKIQDNRESRKRTANQLVEMVKSSPLKDCVSSRNDTESNDDGESKNKTYLSIFNAFDKRQDILLDKFNVYIINYVIEWRKIIKIRVMQALQSFEKLRLEYDHYQRKVSAMEKTLSSINQRGKPIDQAFTQKMKRNQEKLDETKDRYDEGYVKTILLLNEVTKRSWKDLQPILVKIAQFDSAYASEQIDVFEGLDDMIETLQQIAIKNGMPKMGRLKNLAFDEPEELFTGFSNNSEGAKDACDDVSNVIMDLGDDGKTSNEIDSILDLSPSDVDFDMKFKEKIDLEISRLTDSSFQLSVGGSVTASVSESVDGETSGPVNGAASGSIVETAVKPTSESVYKEEESLVEFQGVSASWSVTDEQKSYISNKSIQNTDDWADELSTLVENEDKYAEADPFESSSQFSSPEKSSSVQGAGIDKNIEVLDDLDDDKSGTEREDCSFLEKEVEHNSSLADDEHSKDQVTKAKQVLPIEKRDDSIRKMIIGENVIPDGSSRSKIFTSDPSSSKSQSNLERRTGPKRQTDSEFVDFSLSNSKSGRSFSYNMMETKTENYKPKPPTADGGEAHYGERLETLLQNAHNEQDPENRQEPESKLYSSRNIQAFKKDLKVEQGLMQAPKKVAIATSDIKMMKLAKEELKVNRPQGRSYEKNVSMPRGRTTRNFGRRMSFGQKLMSGFRVMGRSPSNQKKHVGNGLMEKMGSKAYDDIDVVSLSNDNLSIEVETVSVTGM